MRLTIKNYLIFVKSAKIPKQMNWATLFLKLIPNNFLVPNPSEDLFWTLSKKQ